MNYCKSCKFYTKPLLGKPRCERISNYNVVKKKNIPLKLEESFKICTGYFFEHEKSDLFKCSDDALSDKP